MKFQHLLTVASLLALAHASPLRKVEERVPDAAYPPPASACSDYCAGTAFNASLANWYVCGDARLGPVRLPSNFPLNGLFSTYHRFGGLCPGPFLEKWFNETTGYYIYPSLGSGFQLDTTGKAIKGNFTLPVGLLIDRFGGVNGTYVSPEGAPYLQRSLPPNNLDTPRDSSVPYNYHVYNVTKSFNASSGPIAGWFGQPGQGVQYQLPKRIADLLAEGSIVEMDLSNC